MTHGAAEALLTRKASDVESLMTRLGTRAQTVNSPWGNPVRGSAPVRPVMEVVAQARAARCTAAGGASAPGAPTPGAAALGAPTPGAPRGDGAGVGKDGLKCQLRGEREGEPAGHSPVDAEGYADEPGPQEVPTYTATALSEAVEQAVAIARAEAKAEAAAEAQAAYEAQLAEQLQSAVESARSEAHAEGFEAGCRSRDEELAALTERTAEGLATLETTQRALESAARSEAVELAFALAETVVHSALGRDRELVAGLVDATLLDISGGSAVKVRCNPEDHPTVVGRLAARQESGALASFELQSSPSIERGGLVVQLAEGQLEASPRRHLQSLLEAVRSRLEVA